MRPVLISLVAAVLLPATDWAFAEEPLPQNGKADVSFNYIQAGGSGGAPRARRRRTLPPYTAGKVDKGGTIQGTVTYKGAVPEPKPIQIVKDKEHCGKRSTSEPRIAVNADGRVKEAVVFIGDIRSGKEFEPRKSPAQINQHICTFEPHIQVVRPKEPVEVVNSDPVAHNINATQGVYTVFNVLQPSKDMRSTKTFEKPGLVEIKCNVHDWMHGFLYVLPHPYAVVTAENGEFSLENVPAGKYELVVWQEHLGEQVFAVEVKAGETAKMDIVMEARSGQ